MFKKIVALGVLSAMIFSFAWCKDNKPTEAAQNGAYFATGNEEYAVVVDNLITISKNIPASSAGAATIVSDVFEFSLDGDSYVGENARKTISFKFSDNKLTAKIALHGMGAKKVTFKKNITIELSEEVPTQLDASNISTDGSGISWSFTELKNGNEISYDPYRIGVLGGVVEIKRTDSDVFDAIAIRDFIPAPAWFFYVHFPDLKLIQGTSIIRVSHIGGPYLQNEKIHLSINSEPVYFRVTLEVYGNFIVEKIDQ